MNTYKALLAVVAVIGLVVGVGNAALSVVTVQDNFNDGDYTNGTVWNPGTSTWHVTNTWGSRTFASNFIEPTGATGSKAISTPSGTLDGKWELEFDMQWGLGADYFYAMVLNDSSQGYGIQWQGNDSIAIYQWRTLTNKVTMVSGTKAQNAYHHYDARNKFYRVKLVREDLDYDGILDNDNLWLYVNYVGDAETLVLSACEYNNGYSEFNADTATTLKWQDVYGDTRKTKLLDQITLSTVPEPATMVLLGLGGVGLLIRRRRK